LLAPIAFLSPGCSLVVDTSSVPVTAVLEHPSPLYEGLGAGLGSRAVPIVVREADLREGDEGRVIPGGGYESASCSDECIQSDTFPELFCCAGPYVGDGGLAAMLVRLPTLTEHDDGNLELGFEFFRDGAPIAGATTEIDLLPQLDVPTDMELDESFGPNEILVLSQVDIDAGGVWNLDDSGLAPRIRVTGKLLLDGSRDGKDAALIRTYAGSCMGCAPGTEGTTYPLTGGGPDGDGEAGGGVLAIEVNGVLWVDESDLDGDPPVLFSAPSTIGGGGGAIVLAIEGEVEGRVALNVTGFEPGHGVVRTMTQSEPLVSGLHQEGPRLLVSLDGASSAPLPSITTEEAHELVVRGASVGSPWYVVEHGGELQTFTADDDRVEFVLKPGLNRVCALVAELETIPEDRPEVGQCFYSVYLP